MASEQSKTKRKIKERISRFWGKEVGELIPYFKLSLLQMELDYEEYLKNPTREYLTAKQLRLIALDKILRLYFYEDYVCIYDEENGFLLTQDEKKYLENPDSQDLILIKNSFVDKSLEYIKYESIILKFRSKKNTSEYLDILKKIFT